MSNQSIPVERRVASGSLFAAISFALSVLQTIVQVPLLLKFWSPSEYGMWMAVVAATSLVTRLDIGHQSYVGNLFNRYWVEDRKQLKSVFASAVLGAAIVAIVELLAGILMFYFGKTEWLSGPVSEKQMGTDFRIAFFAYLLFWVAQGSVGGILSRLYQPAGLFARSQVIGIIYYFIGFVGLVVAAAFGASIVGAMLAQLGGWILCNIFMFWDVKVKFPEFYPWWRGGNLLLAWKNLRASMILTINGLVEQAGSSGLVLLVAGILAPVEVAVFTTIRTVGNTALQGVTILLYPLVPDIVRYHFQSDPRKLDAVFALAWCIAGTFVCIGFSASIPIVDTLYRIWTHHLLPFNPVLFSLVVLAVCIRQWAAPLQTYLHGVNYLAPQTIAMFLRTAATLLLAALFLKVGGIAIAGVALLAGEVLAGAVCYYAARKSLSEMSGGISSPPVYFSLLQICVMGGGLILGVSHPPVAVWSTPSSVLLIVVLGLIQWRLLDTDVKKRVLGLIPKWKKPV